MGVGEGCWVRDAGPMAQGVGSGALRSPTGARKLHAWFKITASNMFTISPECGQACQTLWHELRAPAKPLACNCFA